MLRLIVGGRQVAITDRRGGESRPPFDTRNLGGHVGDDPAAVVANVARTRRELGAPPVAWMEQVHGRDVAVLTSAPPDGFVARGVDALVTADPGTALAVLVADCVPVVLADPATGAKAVMHAGRRGFAAGVVPATLAALAGLGARADRLAALLGPAICGRCYEVPQSMHDAVAGYEPAASATTRDGTPGLDLRRGVVAQLVAGGLAAGAVRVCTACTAESADYYSFRRDGRTGRFAALVW